MNPTLKRALLWLGGVVLAARDRRRRSRACGGAPTRSARRRQRSTRSPAIRAVTVTKAADGWEFAPAAGAEPSAALVYYPGGHVDARSYAPYARDVAARGYLVVIPVMPLSLAVLSPNAADKVVAAHPGRLALGHRRALPRRRDGRAVRRASTRARWAASCCSAPTCPTGNDLSHDRHPCAHAGRNARHRRQPRRTSRRARALLPAIGGRTTDLDGGNHAQFGDYGPQPGDTPTRTMSAAEQRRRAVEGTVAVLREVQTRAVARRRPARA